MHRFRTTLFALLFALAFATDRRCVFPQSEPASPIPLSHPIPSGFLLSGGRMIVNIDGLLLRAGVCAVSPPLAPENKSWFLSEDLALTDCAASGRFGSDIEAVRLVIANGDDWAGFFCSNKRYVWKSLIGGRKTQAELPADFESESHAFYPVASAKFAYLVGHDRAYRLESGSKSWEKIEYLKGMRVADLSHKAPVELAPTVATISHDTLYAAIDAGEWGGGAWKFDARARSWVPLLASEKSGDNPGPFSSFADSSVHSLSVNDAGEVLVTGGLERRGQEFGFVRTSGRKDELIAHSSVYWVGSEVKDKEQVRGLPFTVPTRSLLAADGTVYIAMRELGALRFENDAWVSLSSRLEFDEIPSAFTIDPAGNIFIGTTKGSIYRWDRSSVAPKRIVVPK